MIWYIVCVNIFWFFFKVITLVNTFSFLWNEYFKHWCLLAKAEKKLWWWKMIKDIFTRVLSSNRLLLSWNDLHRCVNFVIRPRNIRFRNKFANAITSSANRSCESWGHNRVLLLIDNKYKIQLVMKFVFITLKKNERM